jgi:hypothetical protein
LPEIVGLPEFRAFWCEEEYDAAERAWFWVRDTYILKSPGGASGHQVKYAPTSEPDLQAIRDRLVQNRVLERFLEVIEQAKKLPDDVAPRYLRDDVTIIAKSCGEANAYWDGNDRNLIVCYELVKTLYELSEDEGMRELVEQIREFHRDN